MDLRFRFLNIGRPFGLIAAVRPRHDLRAIFLSLLVALTSGLGAETAADERVRGNEVREPWILSVVKIRIPVSRLENARRKHFFEDCSATWLDSASERQLLLTAWHCIEGFSANTSAISLTHQERALNVRIAATGGSMRADWAILEVLDANVVERGLSVSERDAETGESIAMAGFSGDAELGDGGNTLTVDLSCLVTQEVGAAMESNCTAFKGASGGPVLRQTPTGMDIVGVISSGDSIERSRFAPASLFVRQLSL